MADDQSMELKILETAERLFLGKGYALVSTTEIAREAGCNQALVHYYFRTKEKLFDAVFKKKAKLFLMEFLKISDEPLPFEEKLRRKVSAHYDMLLANPQIPFLIMNEVLTNPERLNELKETLSPIVGTVFGQLESELREEIRKGTVRPMSAFDIILTLISLNIVPFLGASVMKKVLGLDDDGVRSVLLGRKNENIEIILRSLRP